MRRLIGLISTKEKDSNQIYKEVKESLDNFERAKTQPTQAKKPRIVDKTKDNLGTGFSL